MTYHIEQVIEGVQREYLFLMVISMDVWIR
jgi:hypothetical protein